MLRKDSLFEDEDEDDLFGESATKKAAAPAPTVIKAKPARKSRAMLGQSGLFGEDDDDDLFGGKEDAMPNYAQPVARNGAQQNGVSGKLCIGLR